MMPRARLYIGSRAFFAADAIESWAALLLLPMMSFSCVLSLALCYIIMDDDGLSTAMLFCAI